MINTDNVVHVLSSLVPKQSTSTNGSSPISVREADLAHPLLKSIEAIGSCASCTAENETTVELDIIAEQVNTEDSDSDSDGDDKSYDDNWQQKDENLRMFVRHAKTHEESEIEKCHRRSIELDEWILRRSTMFSSLHRVTRVVYVLKISAISVVLERK